MPAQTGQLLSLAEMEFPKRLSTLRKELGLTQDALSEAPGIHVVQKSSPPWLHVHLSTQHVEARRRRGSPGVPLVVPGHGTVSATRPDGAASPSHDR